MSTANAIPETWNLTGDDAKQTLADTGRRRLARDAFLRLRWADGFSHARSMAFALSLVLVQGVIALVGLASAMGNNGLSQAIVRTLKTAVPGPAGTVLTGAVSQAHRAGSAHRYTALLLGLTGALITGTTLMGQLERGMNRLYGVEQDRSTSRKYGRAFLLMLSAGVLSVVGFACVAMGRAIGSGIGDDVWIQVWNVARWPLGLVMTTAAIALLFRWCPRRHQPGWSWLAFGALVAVVLWVLVTLALELFFSVSSSFGDTYGPLAGIVALLLWSLASSVALLYGGALAAQLEAVRAGVPAPQDPAKVILPEAEPRRTPVMVGERRP